MAGLAFPEVAINGRGVNVSVVVPVTAAAYSANEVFGGKLTIANVARAAGKQVIIQTLTFTLQDDLSPDLDYFLFTEDPGSSTLTDNGSPTIHTNDTHKRRGPIRIASTDWKTPGSSGARQAVKMGLGWAITLVGTSLYAAVITRTAVTPSANALQIHHELLRD